MKVPLPFPVLAVPHSSSLAASKADWTDHQQKLEDLLQDFIDLEDKGNAKKRAREDADRVGKGGHERARANARDGKSAKGGEELSTEDEAEEDEDDGDYEDDPDGTENESASKHKAKKKKKGRKAADTELTPNKAGAFLGLLGGAIQKQTETSAIRQSTLKLQTEQEATKAANQASLDAKKEENRHAEELVRLEMQKAKEAAEIKKEEEERAGRNRMESALVSLLDKIAGKL